MRVITRVINMETRTPDDGSYVSVMDLTARIQEAAAETYIKNGTVTVFVPGTTASVATIEWEEGLIEDFKETWARLVPPDRPYRHKFLWEENNAFSHIRSTMMGQSVVIPVVNMRLTLGQFQHVVLVDFDNRPRNRQVALQFMGE